MEKENSTSLTLSAQEDPTTPEFLGEEFISSLPECMIEPAKKLPPEWFSMPENELKNFLYPRTEKNSTYEVDQRLRALFWLERERCTVQNSKRMILRNICQDVMLPPNFVRDIPKNPKRLAWLLYPFGSHMAEISVQLKTGNDRINEILQLPLTRKICRCHWGCICNKKQKEAQDLYGCACRDECVCPALTDHKTAELMLKIYERVELRAKGSIPQVINQRIQSLSVHKHLPSQPEKEEQPIDMAALDARIRELEIITSSSEPGLPPSRQVTEFIEASSITPNDGKAEILEAELIPVKSPSSGSDSEG